MRLLFVATLALVSAAAAAAQAPSQTGQQTPAQIREAKGKALVAKWAGSYDTDGFLNDPEIGPALKQLLGAEYDHLIVNLNVKGSVDLIGGTLVVSGNAPHGGTEEEAVVCVYPIGPAIQAAILSKGTITAYAPGATYDTTSICIRDWITQVNSKHIDRFEQPKNVRVVKRP